MHFPRLKFADTNGLFKQIEHIESELKEVREAYVEPDIFHLAEEIVDVMVSSMTALRIIERTHGIDIEDVIDHVHAKNRSRGYESKQC